MRAVYTYTQMHRVRARVLFFSYYVTAYRRLVVYYYYY